MTEETPLTTTETAGRGPVVIPAIDPDAYYEGRSFWEDVLGRSWHTACNARWAGEDMPRATRVGNRLFFKGSELSAWLERRSDPLPSADPDADA